ncbi:MAG: Hpt domain-containing protein [Bacteroidota bacterium]
MGYNLEKINAISDGDQDFIVDVVTAFLEEVPGDLVTFQHQVASGNYEGIYQISHKIKPNLDLLGMQESYTANLKIHDWAKAKTNLEAIEPTFKEVQRMINENIVALKKEFNL